MVVVIPSTFEPFSDENTVRMEAFQVQILMGLTPMRDGRLY